MMGNARQARNRQRPAPEREEENTGFGLFQGPLGASWGHGSILLLLMKPGWAKDTVCLSLPLALNEGGIQLLELEWASFYGWEDRGPER